MNTAQQRQQKSKDPTYLKNFIEPL